MGGENSRHFIDIMEKAIPITGLGTFNSGHRIAIQKFSNLTSRIINSSMLASQIKQQNQIYHTEQKQQQQE